MSLTSQGFSCVYGWRAPGGTYPTVGNRGESLDQKFLVGTVRKEILRNADSDPEVWGRTLETSSSMSL